MQSRLLENYETEPFADGVDVMLSADDMAKCGMAKLSMDEVLAMHQQDAVPAEEVSKLLDEIEQLRGENIFLKQQLEEVNRMGMGEFLIIWLRLM